MEKILFGWLIKPRYLITTVDCIMPWLEIIAIIILICCIAVIIEKIKNIKNKK